MCGITGIVNLNGGTARLPGIEQTGGAGVESARPEWR